MSAAALDGATGHHRIGEARWPMAAAVVAAMILTALLPKDLRFGPSWALPVVEGVLFLAVVLSDPGRIDRLGESTVSTGSGARAQDVDLDPGRSHELER